MSLRSQRRMASGILKCGANKVWIDPDEGEKVLSAITRNDVRKLIHEGVVKALPETGVSRGRARSRHLKKRAGRRSGPGSRSGSRKSISTWTPRIRAIRRRLRDLRDKRMIEPRAYRQLLLMAKGGAFRNSTHVGEYVEARRLLKRR